MMNIFKIIIIVLFLARAYGSGLDVAEQITNVNNSSIDGETSNPNVRCHIQIDGKSNMIVEVSIKNNFLNAGLDLELNLRDSEGKLIASIPVSGIEKSGWKIFRLTLQAKIASSSSFYFYRKGRDASLQLKDFANLPTNLNGVR